MGDILAESAVAKKERRRWAARDSRSPTEEGMDLLRLLEYPQLLGRTYLDHAGTTQWAKSLTHGFAQLMTEDLFGNPHSESTPSKLSDIRIEACREKALRFFNADPEHFDLIWVPNATGAIKLVHDCFRDYSAAVGRHWWYGYHKDSHTSVVGVREGAHKHRCFRYDREVELWIDSRGLAGAEPHEIGLFAYPGQSNMTGKRLPLNWPARIRSCVRAETYVLLDAAALASTAEIDLSDHNKAPDFLAVSFYKIFGFPNLGALIVRKTAAPLLERRKFFGGGTVDMVIAVNDSWAARKPTLHSRLEDGTLPFSSIFALDLAIDTHRKLYGPSPMKYISMHTCRLIKKLFDQLVSLRHSNGIPVVVVYKDKATVYGEAHLQGATIALNIQKPIGGLVPFTLVEQEADKQDIYVRSGSLCNPGGFATHLDWSPKQLHDAFAEGHRCSEPLQEFCGKALGVVRVSLGGMSSDEDIQRFVHFVKETYVNRVFETGGPILMPEFIKAPGSAGSTTKRNVSTCVLQVSSQQPHREERLPPLPMEKMLTVEDVAQDSVSAIDMEKPFSMKSSSSRLRRVRRSIFGALSLKY